MESCIVIDDVEKIFTTQEGLVVRALDKINLEVKENDFICVVGPSGCGKSTLLRIIAGLESTSKGNILYRGVEMNKPIKEVGMVFQNYSLLPWRTVLDNIALGLEFRGISKKERENKARHYLNIIGMNEFENAYPYELSGGMQQRVAIARALANDPDILLMDEPFGALDAYTRIILQKELLKIWESNKKTILFVTHSVDEAVYLSDRIVVMSSKPGKIKDIIEIDMSRPRDRANPEYAIMTARLLDMLEDENMANNLGK
ncbi:ABC-type nitrate/sulfonate/bicarbonate transport system, ATPase component [Gottschalkia purinilytica]|uniref:ABC-type quaternary amine transporter n=1 Tax=Gottschalkia purinilytica TaxID=1503 RepID=A0A0L0W8X1_GOTPU|nr:ABC transporter ATP-binding protein [Gottschalkia purinilytica]KNF07907.1 ABC-type nitrate/sulfonate/bicarbonate transport system, ATPase component [Gottschalkia purinilytica]